MMMTSFYNLFVENVDLAKKWQWILMVTDWNAWRGATRLAIVALTDLRGATRPWTIANIARHAESGSIKSPRAPLAPISFAKAAKRRRTNPKELTNAFRATLRAKLEKSNSLRVLQRRTVNAVLFLTNVKMVFTIQTEFHANYALKIVRRGMR